MATNSKRKGGSGLNYWLGWGLSTLALLFLNRKSSSSSDSNSEPASLSINSTKIGTVIPVVMGQCLIKSPLTSYWGDFRAKIYTEEYGMHTAFNWASIIPNIILSIMALCSQEDKVKSEGTAKTAGLEGVVFSETGGTCEITTPTAEVNTMGETIGAGAKRERMIMAIVNMFITLLTALFTNHLGRTTVQKGFKYYLGYQQILCWASPNARLKRIYMNENEVWSGDEPASNHLDGSPFVIKVNNENLFGGPDENGGFVGELHVYFGGANQTGDAWMRSQMQADSVQAELRGYTPAYRPYISVVVPTAYVGKQATIPTMWYEIEIIPDGLDKLYKDTDYYKDVAENSSQYTCAKIGDDANPAEVLYEIVTNNDWGLAEKATSLDLDALAKMAAKIYGEKLGISTLLTSKETARTVVDNICDHINGIRYADPSTGLMVHRLIRAEDTKEKMLTVNEYNCSDITFTRQDWANTVSEISVSFTDRSARYETGTLSADDPANIEIQNGIKTTKSYNFDYFTTSSNALWAAKREGNTQGYPLATVSLKCDRNLSTLRLGDCFLLNFPSYGISNMIFRATSVNLSNFEDGTVQIEAMEDVFALAKTTFEYSGSTEWERDPILPEGVQIWGVFELPYEMIKVYDTYVNAYACQPNVNTASYTIWRKKDKDSDFQTTNTISKWIATGKLVYDYPETGEVEDLIGFQVREVAGIEDLKFELNTSSMADINTARTGSKVLIMGDEMMAYSGLTKLPNGNWSITGVIRGIYDTVPHNHVSTDVVIFLQSGHYGNVTTGGAVCKQGETAEEVYNITTASVDKQESFDSSRNLAYTTVRRTERPCVQGKIRLTAHMQSDKYFITSMSGDLTATWVPRNKELARAIVSQDDTHDYYLDTVEITRPDDENYVVDVIVNGKTIYTDKTTTPAFTYTWAQRCKDEADLTAETKVSMYCELNGLESYQKQERTFLWNIPTIAGFAQNEADGAALLKSLDVQEQVVLQTGLYNNVQYIDYIDSPVILLGKPAQSKSDSGAMLASDGNYWLPSGDILTFSDKDTYTVETIAEGYTLRSWFKEIQLTVEEYYRWNGVDSFEKVNKDGSSV